MKRNATALVLGIFFCLLYASAGLCADSPRLDNSVFDHPRRPAAIFDHDAHNEKAGVEDCAVCHHVWENGKVVKDDSSEGTPCSDCHGQEPTQDNSVSLINAYHTQCRSCHIKEGKGPLLCGQCHKNMTKEGDK